MAKTLLFSVTASDCKFDFYRGSGPGGQKKNKTSSACRCTHVASGAVGTAEDSRSQLTNKRNAFKRMAESKKFKDWHKIEVSRLLGHEQVIKDKINYEMEHNTRLEVKDLNGRWINDLRV